MTVGRNQACPCGSGKKYKRCCGLLPKKTVLANTDGEPLERTDQTFEIADLPALEKELSSRPDVDPQADGSYRWIRERDDGSLLSLATLYIADSSLTASTNSLRRATAVREFLGNLPGIIIPDQDRSPNLAEAALGIPLDLSADEGEPARGEKRAWLTPEKETAVLHAYRDRLYRKWLREPLKGFSGLTPRQIVLLPALRPQIVHSLKQFEVIEANRASEHGTELYDLSWLWKELGLDRKKDA